MRKVASEHLLCVLIYTNSYIFEICFMVFILLQYLIFDFICLTLSLADTHEIAKYDSWSLSHLGYLYPERTPVMIKLDHNRSCPWV